MRKSDFSALAVSAVLFALPAHAGQVDVVQMASNDRMPFPAFMQALTGDSGQSRPAARTRTVPQPYFAAPQAGPSRAAVAPQRTYRRVEPRQQVSTYTRQPDVLDNRPARVMRAEQPHMDPRFLPTVVAYDGGQPAGTIVIDTDDKFLYLVQGDGTARRYGVGVGRPGFEWAGSHRVTRKAEWPGWTPPAEMRQRQPGLPTYMEGGPKNPLGARALYLGSTLYRIHGTSQPWTIGQAVSSGCIRMRNEDVMDLYNRVGVGTKVIVS